MYMHGAIASKAYAKRKLLPGAAESAGAFQALWDQAKVKMARLETVEKIKSTTKDTGIILSTAALYKFIQDDEKTSGWSANVCRFAVAALTIYRMRLIDISTRDHVT